MTDIGTAKTLLAIARAHAEHGKPIERHLLAELELIAADRSLPHFMQREAARLVGMESEAA